MSALDKLDRRLTLTYSAVSEDKYTLSVHLDENAVDSTAGSKAGIERCDYSRHERARSLVGSKQRHAVSLCGLKHLVVYVKTGGGDHRNGMERKAGVYPLFSDVWRQE